MITDAGLNHIADQMAAQGEAAMSHIAIGSGNAAAAAGDTALQTELARNTLEAGFPSRTNNVVSYRAIFAAGAGTGSVKETGILNAASAGTLLNRVVFTAKDKGANDTLQVDIDLTFSR